MRSLPKEHKLDKRELRMPKRKALKLGMSLSNSACPIIPHLNQVISRDGEEPRL